MIIVEDIMLAINKVYLFIRSLNFYDQPDRSTVLLLINNFTSAHVHKSFSRIVPCDPHHTYTSNRVSMSYGVWVSRLGRWWVDMSNISRYRVHISALVYWRALICPGLDVTMDTGPRRRHTANPHCRSVEA